LADKVVLEVNTNESSVLQREAAIESMTQRDTFVGSHTSTENRLPMIPLLHETHFTFRFGDDRIIPRFHLEGIEAGRPVSVYKIDADSGERRTLMTMASEGGWVDLPEPIVVRAGDAFVAVPEERDPRPLAVIYKLEPDLVRA
jgi:hypothetical protein